MPPPVPQVSRWPLASGSKKAVRIATENSKSSFPSQPIAAVRTSWARLELVNVMHCHNFWSTRDGATGEGRGHDVFETDSGTKGGFHFGDGLENRGMPFDRARLSHPYGSWNRDPSQIIAEEIHDHVKFSGILHAVEQFIGITIARTRPLDGTREQLIAAANEK